ncbi:hypothetical protein DUNSADRAFT_1832 [Dunaliella salina]|nr:hypothetical protein DUNSADRAFT_1832 [Dunaliella salina]|eukprot:KAF5826873.1 hypothetical protein DUNSADRAFT_1832 [Dunaliella salina]
MVGVAAEVAIPPPGGHCAKIALDVVEQVVKELVTNQIMMGLAASCIAHMMYFFDERKIVALESDESLKAALRKFEGCVSKIQAFIHETAGKDSFWLKRLLVLQTTQKKLVEFDAELKEIERSLELGVNVATYAFVQEAHQAQQDVKREVDMLLEKYHCKTVEDLAKNKDAHQELTSIMGVLGPSEVATLASIAEVINKQGVHTLVKNKTMQRLWADRFAFAEKVQWRTFWTAFPDHLSQDKEELAVFFKNEHNRGIFERMVDLGDPEHVDVNEINCVFVDDTSLHDKAKAKVDEFVHNQGAENQVAPILKDIPEDLIRPDQQQLMDVMVKKRLIVVRGSPGEGKFIAACQAGQALFRPTRQNDPRAGGHSFQAIYTASLEGCKSKDATAIDNKLLECLTKIPKLGPRDDQVQSSLNTLFCMDKETSPYNVLLILNHAEEVHKDTRDRFYARLKGILFRDVDAKIPSNFTVVLSSRIPLENIARAENSAFKNICADYQVQQLPEEIAARIFLLEMDQKEGEKVQVSKKEAEQIARSHACNPELLKILAGSIDDQDSLCVALKAPYKQLKGSDFMRNALLECLKRLKDNFPTLMLLVEVVPTGFTKAILKREAVHQVRQARFMIFKNFVTLAFELVETTCEKSMHAYSSAYPMMASNKPYVQGALRLVIEHEQLYMDHEVVNSVLHMLSIMVFDPSLYHLEFVQDACLELASRHPSDNLIMGICYSAASVFYVLGQDTKHGHLANLPRAEKALELLRDDTSVRAVLAKAVALRSKGLILRELYKDLGVAIAAHKQATELLKPFPEDTRAQIETALNLAELSGTADYIGTEVGYEEGIKAGQEAIMQAKTIFVRGGEPVNHPVTALALGALGLNLRNSGKPEAALEVHRQAKEMRLDVCGDEHEATAMSIQQMGLCYKDMGHFVEAEKNLKLSLSIREKLQRTNNMIGLIANSQYELASLYMAMGKDSGERMDDAVEYMRRAIAARRLILRPDHKKLQGPYGEIIEMLRHFPHLGLPKEAEEYEALLQAHLDPSKIPPQDRDIHLVELQFCPDTNPFITLERARTQHSHTITRLKTHSLRNPNGNNKVTLHTILIGVGGTIYDELTISPL